ncbi:dockerin type I domain-containing protein [Ruminiclostridium cellulolyticum]|nr:dockerin type I domain-containing protein [Ruminiclostridium cellulolyticum]
MEDDLGAADVNGGKSIDALDYAAVKSYLLLLIAEFPGR